jgi:hypothetical protein
MCAYARQVPQLQKATTKQVACECIWIVLRPQGGKLTVQWKLHMTLSNHNPAGSSSSVSKVSICTGPAPDTQQTSGRMRRPAWSVERRAADMVDVSTFCTKVQLHLAHDGGQQVS